MLGRSPEDVSSFLARTEGLDKTMIGDYLGEREDTSLKVGQGRGALRRGSGVAHGRAGGHQPQGGASRSPLRLAGGVAVWHMRRGALRRGRGVAREGAGEPAIRRCVGVSQRCAGRGSSRATGALSRAGRVPHGFGTP